jgi:hypothetical protein
MKWIDGAKLRIRSPLTATTTDGRGLLVLELQVGSVVYVNGSADRSGLIDVVFEGRPVSMFKADLERYSDCIDDTATAEAAR